MGFNCEMVMHVIRFPIPNQLVRGHSAESR